MRIRPYIEAAFARDWEFEEVDHYPLLEDLNNSLRPMPASFSRESEKYLIEGEIMAHKEPNVPAFLDGYLDLPVKGLMLEQQETNWMRQSANLRSSPWNNEGIHLTQLPLSDSPSDEIPAFRFTHTNQFSGWKPHLKQNIPTPVGSIRTVKILTRIDESNKYPNVIPFFINEIAYVRTPHQLQFLPDITAIDGETDDIARVGGNTALLSKFSKNIGKWRYVEATVRILSATYSYWGIGAVNNTIQTAPRFVFNPCVQERIRSTFIPTTTSQGIRAADILTVKSPQGLKQNKISFDFQYMPQGHSKQYEAVNFNDEVRLLISEYTGYVNIRTMIGDTPYDNFNIETPDLKDTTFKVEILSTRNNIIRVKITVNDEEYTSDGVLSGDVLLADEMTVKGWCVLSNLKVYAGY